MGVSQFHRKICQKATQTLRCEAEEFVVLEWKCENGQMIPSSGVCDGEKNCGGGFQLHLMASFLSTSSMLE